MDQTIYTGYSGGYCTIKQMERLIDAVTPCAQELIVATVRDRRFTLCIGTYADGLYAWYSKGSCYGPQIAAGVLKKCGLTEAEQRSVHVICLNSELYTAPAGDVACKAYIEEKKMGSGATNKDVFIARVRELVGSATAPEKLFTFPPLRGKNHIITILQAITGLAPSQMCAIGDTRDSVDWAMEFGAFAVHVSCAGLTATHLGTIKEPKKKG